MKLISISLYGDKPMYKRGIQENIRLAPLIYPGWTVRVYHDGLLPRVFWEGLPCERVVMEKSREHSGMFWRFLPAFEKGISHVIFRDADSRLNIREAAAVREWLVSGKAFHFMHDHEHHRCLPIFGGMWGVRGGALSADIRRRLNRAIVNVQKRGDDMQFLTRWVMPEAEKSHLRHSSKPVKWLDAKPFPPHGLYDRFVGQQFDENDKPIQA